MTPLAIGAGVVAGAVVGATIANMHSQRRETIEGGRTIYTEPDRIIIRDPSGQQYVRGNDLYRFRYGARDIQTETVGGETRTVVIRPDGSRIITVVGNDGRLLRRIRRDERGREIIIIDNSYRDPRAVGGFYVDLPPPVVSMPYDRYIVSADEASPEVIYDTMVAPPVQRIDRRYSLDEIRYSPNVRMQMPSIDVNSHQLRDRFVGDPAGPGGEAAGDRRRPQPGDPGQPARGVPDRRAHRQGGLRRRQSLAVGPPRRIRRNAADAAVRRAGGEPDLAGLWRAVSEGADGRTERDQPARHDPQHHAAAQWRPGVAAAAPARHRAAAALRLVSTK